MGPHEARILKHGGHISSKIIAFSSRSFLRKTVGNLGAPARAKSLPQIYAPLLLHRRLMQCACKILTIDLSLTLGQALRQGCSQSQNHASHSQKPDTFHRFRHQPKSLTRSFTPSR
ncbi:hypothetical protein Mapa_009190 [Marchantia paleacea]|nr:hypothetical protein Mapa_009190 [Marchantia paleacea]